MVLLCSVPTTSTTMYYLFEVSTNHYAKNSELRELNEVFVQLTFEIFLVNIELYLLQFQTKCFTKWTWTDLQNSKLAIHWVQAISVF